MQSPFSRVGSGLAAEQMISDDKEQDNEQNREQGASQKKSKQHTDRNPKQNKSEQLFHWDSLKRF